MPLDAFDLVWEIPTQYWDVRVYKGSLAMKSCVWQNGWETISIKAYRVAQL